MTKRISMAAALLLSAVSAGAQEATPQAAPAAAAARPPGYHAHDGFYLQMDLGFGGQSSKASQGGISLELSGAGAQFGIGLGGALTPSFLIGGRLFATSVSDPTVKLNGSDLGSANGSVGVSGVGLDLIYYFVPSNFYLGATPAFTRLVVADDSGDTSSTDVGFGLRLAVGKEWWVSDNWALGLSGHYLFSSNQDSGSGSPTWKSNWFGLNFSATYN